MCYSLTHFGQEIECTHTIRSSQLYFSKIQIRYSPGDIRTVFSILLGAVARLHGYSRKHFPPFRRPLHNSLSAIYVLFNPLSYITIARTRDFSSSQSPSFAETMHWGLQNRFGKVSLTVRSSSVRESVRKLGDWSLEQLEIFLRD